MTLISCLSLPFGTWGRPKKETQRGFDLGRPCGIQLGFINTFNFAGSNHHSLPLVLLFDLEATLHLKVSKMFPIFLYLWIYICVYVYMHMDFPHDASGKEPVCQCRGHKGYKFNPWVKKILWRRVWQPTPVFLPRESHGQRTLVGYYPQGRRVRHNWRNLACIYTHIHIYECMICIKYMYLIHLDYICVLGKI